MVNFKKRYNYIILFVLSNIISVILEYGFLFSFLYYLCDINLRKVIIILSVVFIFLLIITIISVIIMHKSDDTKLNDYHNEIMDNFIRELNEKYNTNYDIVYLKAPQPNPAWCLGKTIFINTDYEVESVFLKGVIGHEVGHAVSGLSPFATIASLKPSTMLSKLSFLGVHFFNEKVPFLYYIFVVINFILSINNNIFVAPFIRNDEHYANHFATMIGTGLELRCYYGLVLKNKDPHIEKNDFLHPTVDSMIERMNKDLNLTKEECALYYASGELFYVTPCYKTVRLPALVKTIDHRAFRDCKNVVKVTGKEVTKVNYGGLDGLLKVNELVFPKLQIISINEFNSCPLLENLVIENEELKVRLKDNKTLSNSHPLLIKNLK